MKNLYAHILFAFIFTFLGTQFSYAQDSNVITELREKFKDAKDEKSRNNLKVDMINQFLKEGKNDSAIVRSLQVADYLKKNQKFEDVGRLYMTINTIYLTSGDKVNAEKYRQEAQEYFKMSDKSPSNYLSLLAKAQDLAVNGKIVDAGEVLDQIVKLENEKKEKVPSGYMSNIYQMSISNYYMQNRLPEAYKRALMYLDYMNKNDKENSYLPLYFIGFVQYAMKNYQKSIEALDKSVALLPASNQASLSDIDMMRSSAYLELKNISKAKEYATNAFNITKKADTKQAFPKFYLLFSQIYQKDKDYKQSRDYAQKAYELAPEKDMYQVKARAKQQLNMLRVDEIEDDKINFDNYAEKRESLKSVRKDIEDTYNSILASEIVHNKEYDQQTWEYYAKIDEMLGDYESAFSYYKKYKEIENETISAENIRGVEEVQSERSLTEQKLKIRFEEETKRIQLQKELELKAMRYEFDKKQAAAKTEEERQRLLLEEEHKRREISIKYDEEQKAVALKYAQEKKVAKAEQEKKDAESKAELSKSKNIRNMSIGGAVTALLLLGFAGWSYNQKRKDGIKIAAEKKKSEDLLLNILPQEVAQELKENGKSDAKYYDEVSVLFTDFVNFTATSEKIGVQELLEELNVCFTEFDNIMGRHGLEKIKTIGDAYLAVSGLPTVNKDHAKNAIAASQEILKFIEERKKISPNALDLRIGIHSGHVIAGIVGVKKFAYDIWGDTVNTAARMEQAGEKGKINISKNTYELVKDDFVTTYRGKISVKGKGEQEMYFVEKA